MQIGRPKRLVVALAGAAALVLGTAGGAAAGVDGPLVWNPTGGAASNWQHYGDWYYVYDGESDGHSAVGQLDVPYRGKTYNNWNSLGYTMSESFNYNLSEGARVYYRSCLGESGTGSIFSCNTSWQWAEA